ncbi:MAG: hypothetical protein WC050_04690 [Candidatus Paceibacterota bacterium]
MSLASITAFFTNIQTDWFILFVVTIAIAFDALRSGSARARALTLSLPASYLLYTWLPTSAFIGPLLKGFAFPLAQNAIALGLMLLMFLIVLRATNSWAEGSHKSATALISGIAATVALLVIWMQIPTLDMLWHFGPLIHSIFSIPYALFWILGASMAFALVRD